MSNYTRNELKIKPGELFLLQVSTVFITVIKPIHVLCGAKDQRHLKRYQRTQKR